MDTLIAILSGIGYLLKRRQAAKVEYYPETLQRSHIMKTGSFLKTTRGGFPLAGIIIALMAAALSCGSSTYMTPGESPGTLEPRDTVNIAKYMGDSIHRHLSAPTTAPFRIEMKRLSNRTSAHIDAHKILEALQDNLVKRGVSFIDTDAGKKVMEPSGDLLYLSGTIGEEYIRHPEYRIIHYTIFMRLVNSLTSKVEWTDSLRIEKRERMSKNSF